MDETDWSRDHYSYDLANTSTFLFGISFAKYISYK